MIRAGVPIVELFPARVLTAVDAYVLDGEEILAVWDGSVANVGVNLYDYAVDVRPTQVAYGAVSCARFWVVRPVFYRVRGEFIESAPYGYSDERAVPLVPY